MALPPNMVVPGLNLDDTEGLPDVEVDVPSQIDFSGGAEVIDDGQGGAIVQAMLGMDEESAEELPPIEHDANLAEYLDEAILGEISSELVGLYEEDYESRSEWEETYTKGLDLLGIGSTERTEPFQGASGVTHPLISESVTQFQAQAYKELLPAGGPVRTQVIGLQDAKREDQAQRVKDYMNYQIMEEMEEYDPGMDQMLFYLPLSGSTFKKVYFDSLRGRAVAEFLPAQDLVVSYSATDLASAPRVTHVLKMTDNDVRKMQVSGAYMDIDLSGSGDPEENEVTEKVNQLQGISRGYTDEIRTILEMHCDLDIEEFEDVDQMGEPTGIKLPYIVTIDKNSDQILSIRRNYSEQDPFRKKRPYFVHYKFLPGLGFYGFGLIHMIGGLGRAATSILRQLIDAGTLANLPAGFKARGVRVRNDDEPLQPGEWRDIDAPGGNIRDSLIPLPYKEPSATLAQLLGGLIEDGRRFISIADQQINNMSGETPVGTTVAMLERGMKVMSAIHKRLHYAQKTEFRMLARIFKENMPPEYPYEVAGGNAAIKQSDFDDKIDILPVSDPNIFSMAQRVTLAQTQLQLAQSNPQMHNLHAAYRRMYQALEVQNIDEILPPPAAPAPMDPAMENAKALMGEILQAFPEQNHEVHIEIHIMFMKTPIVATSPQIMGSFMSHIQEHVSMLAKKQAMDEVKQALSGAKMMASIGTVSQESVLEYEKQLQQDLGNQQEVENLVVLYQQKIMAEVLAKLMPENPNEPDPLVAIRMEELELRRQKQGQDAVNDAAKLEVEMNKVEQRERLDNARLDLQEDIAGDRNEVNRERIAVNAEIQQMAMQRRT
tara:strand:+ start:1961 stop:4447 length:2487 start_codon:yes stop_codon:yes gene_type:complete